MIASVYKCLLVILLQFNTGIIDFFLSGTGSAPVKSSLHPFFVSVTEFNHNQKDKTVEISCKMFTDDFENTLKNQFKTIIDLSHTKDKDSKQVEKYIYDYLQKHLQIKINGKPVNFLFVGYEKEEEAVWTYLQINNVPGIKNMEVMNNILYESYHTQISIMHASVGEARKSTRLIYPDTQASFNW